MSKRTRIGLREVRALNLGETIWDLSVAGFAARRQAGSAVAYILKYRTLDGRRQRWYTIGRHGAPWTPEMARKRAQELLGEVAKGCDPAAEKRARRKATTVAELCDMYMADALAWRVLKRNGVSKRGSTLAIDKGRVERHIKPLLGSHSVLALTTRDVDHFLLDVAKGKTAASVKTKLRGLARVRGGKTAANRCTGLLESSPMQFARACGLTIQFMASNALPTPSESAGYLTRSIRHWASPPVRREMREYGRPRLPLLNSSL
jgi:hypothetical protein